MEQGQTGMLQVQMEKPQCEPRRTDRLLLLLDFFLFFSQRGNAEGLVLICLHYPFHSSFKSTKYTFPLCCPPRCSRQKKSNFKQFAPNSSLLPSPGALQPLSLPSHSIPAQTALRAPKEGTPSSPGASKPALTTRGAAFPASPPLGFPGCQGDLLLPPSQDDNASQHQKPPKATFCQCPPSFQEF